MKNIILGLHVSHNSSACIFIDGVLVSAVQEERLTRMKQFEGFPKESIKFVLSEAGIKPSEVNSIAIAGKLQHLENPFFSYASKVLFPLSSFLSKAAAFIKGRFISLKILDKIIYNEKKYNRHILLNLRALGFKSERKIVFFDHHLCHAASAYYTCGDEEALVLTQDGRGDLLSGTIFHAKDKNLTLLTEQDSSDSLAQLYAGVTKYLGFTPLKHEGKITGLAAFGKKTELLDKIEKLFLITPNGAIKRISDSVYKYNQYSSKEKKLINASSYQYQAFTKFGISFQKWLSENSLNLKHEDIAYAIQHSTESIIVRSILKKLEYLKIDKPINICLAGGLFANVKVNQRIRECSPLINNVFVQPAMGDEGLAIGAALLSIERSGFESSSMPSPCLGKFYSDSEIEEELKKWNDKYKYKKYDSIETEIAILLKNGKIVGRFDGKMEFGPRALGNRSILIHPGDKNINNTVNQRLKRTEFMPFAPSVLDFRAHDYFINYNLMHLTAEWMTITYDVYPGKVEEIAAVVHIDNTARPQIVNQLTNKSYYKVLKEFNELTGIGCVVNTSFNMHEEPIVESPFDAMRAFDLGSIDYLAIGNFLVSIK